MGEVTVDIAGRSYRLGCGPDEEKHLAGLAAILVTGIGQDLESRFLLLAKGDHGSDEGASFGLGHRMGAPVISHRSRTKRA